MAGSLFVVLLHEADGARLGGVLEQLVGFGEVPLELDERGLEFVGDRDALEGAVDGLLQLEDVVDGRSEGGDAAELGGDLDGIAAPYYRANAEVMAEVVGFHLNRGVLASASRAPELTVAEVLDGARTVAVLEGVNDHENLGSIFRHAAGLDVDAVVFGADWSVEKVLFRGDWV